MEYNVEQKRHWRYWVWKRIAQNCGVHPSFATVLFLSGPSPLDLAAAQKYGFKLRNIVAVDMGEECVKAARKAGCTAIQGGLHEVVTKWSDGQIHGIVADYCCGLTLDVAIDSFQMAMMIPACAFNFQRGREIDAVSRRLRESFECKDRAMLMKIVMNVVMAMAGLAINAKGPNPSGFVRHIVDAGSRYQMGEKEFLAERAAIFDAYFSVGIKSGLFSKQLLMDLMGHPAMQAIETFSYRSNKVVMDSMVGSFLGCDTGYRENMVTPSKNNIDKRLAATKAIRTMNGAVRFAGSN